MGRFGLAQIKVWQVGRKPGSPSTHSLPANLFLRSSKIVTARFGLARHRIQPGNSARFTIAVSGATERMVLLAEECSICMRTREEISGPQGRTDCGGGNRAHQ